MYPIRKEILMNKDDIFRTIQEYTTDVPLLLIGTGASIPVGIPGMPELADYLLDNLDSKYSSDKNWCDISKKLKSGIDLESAMTSYHLDENLLNDIKKLTWKLVTDADLKLFYEKVLFGQDLPLSLLLHKLIQPHPYSIDILTTNYDRYIEYCCDQIGVMIDNRYSGMYLKKTNHHELNKKNVVNLLKVHGSLDSFSEEKTNESISIPLQQNIPNGFIPEIITPGSDKYKAILTSTSREILHNADSLIDKASNFLCIGYGFNDSQIQEKIITKIKVGTPIVVVTKSLTDNALDIINSNSGNYAVIMDGGENKTRFIINKTDITLEGVYWTISGFNEII